jgi:hypothetical protein
MLNNRFEEALSRALWIQTEKFVPNVSPLQLAFCLDRLQIVKASIPQEAHTCVDQPDLPCFPCDLATITKPRIELELLPNQTVLCRILIGDFEVESFSPGLYC